MKATEAQKRSMRKWRKTHKAEARVSSYRTSARTFIRHYASEKDLDNLQNMINKYRPIVKRRSIRLG